MTDDNQPPIPIETLAETENYTIWSAVEPDSERTYHLELGPVTAHFFQEEWDAFVDLMRQAAENPQAVAIEEDDDSPGIQVELDWGTLDFDDDEWAEFVRLIRQA